MTWASKEWTMAVGANAPADRYQFIDRLHRPGQDRKPPLTIWIDEAAEIDEMVLERLQSKAERAIRDHVKLNMRAELEKAKIHHRPAARRGDGPQG